MLKACYRAIALIAATIGLLAPLSRATAQTSQVLIDYTSTWRWDQSGSELGTAWRDFSYPAESTWQTGQGLLGLEGAGVYPVPINTTLSVPTPITSYFRIHFNYTGVTNGAFLVASNYVDDGCVMYLNGTEVLRLRVPAAQNSTTQASGGPAAEGTNEVANLPVGALRNGDNVLAVEVHQSGTASSDLAWGTKLVIVIPTAVAITTQPQSQTIPLGSPVTFSVGISGGPANYQWQKDTVNLSGATNSSYTIGTVSAGSAGSYRVRVFNSVNSVTSSPAVLTVSSDTTPPSALSAIVREVSLSFTNIEVTVDEPLVAGTAVATNNYTVRNSSTGQVIPVVNALYNYPTIRLSVTTNSGFMYRSNYYVQISGLTDTRGNVMQLTNIGVSWRITNSVMQMTAPWKYFASAIFTTEPYNNQQWKNVNYVPNPIDWGDGIGIFAFGLEVAVFCAGDGQGTTLSYQREPTLFRGNFSLPTNALRSSTLTLRHFIDDGAVFYLNGTEIHRYNVGNPGSVVTTNTLASGTISPTCQTASISVTNLSPGQNLLAVAVCDGPTIESEVAFGVEMDYVFLQTGSAPPPPVLPAPRFTSIIRNGNDVTMTWTNTGAILLTSTNVSAPNANWTTVSGATTPYTTQVTNTAQFYRLRNP